MKLLLLGIVSVALAGCGEEPQSGIDLSSGDQAEKIIEDSRDRQRIQENYPGGPSGTGPHGDEEDGARPGIPATTG